MSGCKKFWHEWLQAFFKRMHMRATLKTMAAWGRLHYGVTAKDNKKACKELAALLMGKQSEGAFKPVVVWKYKNTKKPSPVPAQTSHPQQPKSKIIPAWRNPQKFYASWEWKKARYQVLQRFGAKCMLCGATPESGAKICVDHIKPRALDPALELDTDNLQVLCDDCNMGKGRWDQTDWRQYAKPKS